MAGGNALAILSLLIVKVPMALSFRSNLLMDEAVQCPAFLLPKVGVLSLFNPLQMVLVPFPLKYSSNMSGSRLDWFIDDIGRSIKVVFYMSGKPSP